MYIVPRVSHLYYVTSWPEPLTISYPSPHYKKRWLTQTETPCPTCSRWPTWPPTHPSQFTGSEGQLCSSMSFTSLLSARLVVPNVGFTLSYTLQLHYQKQQLRFTPTEPTTSRRGDSTTMVSRACGCGQRHRFNEAPLEMVRFEASQQVNPRESPMALWLGIPGISTIADLKSSTWIKVLHRWFRSQRHFSWACWSVKIEC